MPPTSKKKLGGILVWACLSVHLCVTLALGQEPLEIGSCNLVCGMSMKIKKTCIFFLSIGFVIAELLPFSKFFILLHCKPTEACEQNISTTAWARVIIFGSQIVSKV